MELGNGAIARPGRASRRGDGDFFRRESLLTAAEDGAWKRCRFESQLAPL
jgi:hypothetical protein